MTAVASLSPGPSAAVRPARSLPRVSPVLGVIGLALITAAARLVFLARPLTSDEGGFLLLAHQWAPGPSLYGHYWVDRPPLLIAYFALADHLGGAVALRWSGLLLVATSVVLAGLIGRLVSRSPLPAAAAAAAFLITPVFGGYEIDGELIAIPVILLGLVFVLKGARDARAGWFVAAGATAAVAVLIKQNEIDLFLAVPVVAAGLVQRFGARRALQSLGFATLGAAAVAAVVLTFAGLRGTGVADLWDAMVTFRVTAGTVITTSASAATHHRLVRLGSAFLISGAPLVLGLFLVRFRGLSQRCLALTLIAWESFSVLAGGSYWLHYLLCLVPGLVVAVAALSGRVGARWLTPVLGYAVLAAVFELAPAAMLPGPMTRDVVLEGWLQQHAPIGDTAVIAYGHPEVLQVADLSSPYDELWSLPVRVRDPRLESLAGVLRGPRRPTWVVLDPSLRSWGIDPHLGEVQLALHYRPVAIVDGFRVYAERTAHRCATMKPC